MRYLTFADTKEQALLSSIYAAIMNPEAPIKGAVAVRRHGKIADKMEALGELKDEIGLVVAQDAPVVLALEDAEFEMVRSCIEACPWTPAASRRIAPLFDMLENAPTVDPNPAPSSPKLE